MEIKSLTRWRHKPSGIIYLVRRLCMVEVVLGKGAYDYGWAEGVVYKVNAEDTDAEFVSMKNRFLERFEPVE